MTKHLIANGDVCMTVEWDAPKAPKRIYSLEEVKEQIQWHEERAAILKKRIQNGECVSTPKDAPGEWCGTGDLVEEVKREREDASQNASISHDVAPGSIKTTHPYPPYGLDEIVAYKSNKEVSVEES